MDQTLLDTAQTEGVVVGLGPVLNDIAQRLDIDVMLLTQPDTFNLFILAFDELVRDTDAPKILGYYQVAGIHGLPRAAWDGVDPAYKSQRLSQTSRGAQGYCTHGSVLFMTWHRPYLLMIEQTIFNKMLEWAKKFSDSGKQIEAAKKFRLPYWDYYRPRGREVHFTQISTRKPGEPGEPEEVKFDWDFSLPKIFTTSKIVVRKPESEDQLVDIDNPFRSFPFPTNGGLTTADWDLFNGTRDALPEEKFPRTHTARYTDKETDPINEMNLALCKSQESLQSRLIDFMTDNKTFGHYNRFVTDATRDGSLEGVHGTYHLVIGGSGHMSRVPVAAFDPVFWFHHRYEAWEMYSAVQANLASIVTSTGGQQFGRHFTRRHRVLRVGSPTHGNQMARYTEKLGYDYPDVQGVKDVRETFLKNYTWAVRSKNGGNMGKPPPNMEPLDLSKAQCYQKPSEKPVSALQQTFLSTAAMVKETVQSTVQSIAVSNNNPGNSTRTWYVDDQVERLALNGAFGIYFFVGYIDPNQPKYITAPTLAGLHYVFAAPSEACDNCGRQEEQATIVYSSADITPSLLDRIDDGDLESLAPEHVEAYLKKNLKWRVVDVNGEEYPLDQIRGLQLSVSSKVEPLPIGSGEPTFEEYPNIVPAADNS